MPISPKPHSSPRFGSSSLLLDVPSSSSSYSHTSSSNSHPSQQQLGQAGQRSSSGSFLRSPSPSHQALLLPTCRSPSPSHSQSSYLNDLNLMPVRPPMGARSVSSNQLLSVAGPSPSLGQTFARLKAKAMAVLFSASSSSRPRKQSLLGEDDKEDGTGSGLLPSMHRAVVRKGWRTGALDSLWWLIFWSAVVIYLRALGGFGAQETVLWEDRKVKID